MEINELLVCQFDKHVHYDRDDVKHAWTLGEKYSLYLNKLDNKLVLESDSGLIKTCLLCFPSAVLLIVFNYNLIPIKDEMRNNGYSEKG